MTLSYLDLLITAVIIATVLWSAHRLGQANPVGTGKLARRLDALELKVAEQGARMEGIEVSVIKLADAMRTTATGVEAMRMELAADRGVTERTWSAVDRMQHYFIEDGIRGRRG